jgi:hypothetical protein
MKISALAVEQGFEDDFSDSRDSVYVNSFSVTSSVCAQKMSSSAVELGFLDDFWVLGSLFSSKVSEPRLVYLYLRFQRQP